MSDATIELKAENQSLELTNREGVLWLYAAAGGGVFVCTRNAIDERIHGISIDTDDLPELARAILKLHKALAEHPHA